MPPKLEYTDKPLHEKASQIAANMGWQWAYSFEESSECSALIVGPDGMALWVGRARGAARLEDDRLTITGRYPAAADGYGRKVFAPRYEERPRITVAARRPAPTIAREILRRFVPRYAPHYQEGLEKKVRWLEARQRREAALDRLARVLGTHRPADVRDRTKEVRIPFSGIYGRIQVLYDGQEGNVNISSLPIELVYRIAELIAQHYT